MSVSGSRAAVEINLEEFEKRLRAAGAQHLGAEDPLSELARLVETARPAPPAPAPAPPPAPRKAVEPAPRPIVAAPAPAPTLPRVTPELELKPAPRAEPVETLETAALRPALEEADVVYPDAEVEAEAPVVEPEDVGAFRAATAVPAGERSSRKWLVSVSALAIAGVAMLGAAFALKGGLPSLPGASKAPPYIAAAPGPTRVQPPTDATVAAPAEAGGPLMKDANPSAPVKVVSSEEQPVDLAAQTAAATASAPPSGGDMVMKGTADTPVVAPTAANPPPTFASQFPDPKPVRTVSLRPDGTPVPASAVASAAPAPAPAPAAKPAEPVTPQASTPKIELPTKLNGKSSARVVVAKTDTTAPANGGADEPAKPAKPAKSHEAAAEPKAAAVAPTETAATGSGGWSVQLAAPRSEAEAKSTAAKLNDKYASALNGAPIGVHKATVNGDTIYRLRVGGLSKADAAALCARLKGDGGQCFIAK